MISYQKYMQSVMDDNVKIFDKIVDKINIDIIKFNEIEIYNLLFAIDNESYKIIKYLIDKNVNINFLFEDTIYGTQRAIHYEIIRSSDKFNQCFGNNPEIEIINLLIGAGSDINAKNGDEKTPLDIAIDHNHYTGIEILNKLNAKRGH